MFVRTSMLRKEQFLRLARTLNKDMGATFDEAMDALEAKVRGQK